MTSKRNLVEITRTKAYVGTPALPERELRIVQHHFSGTPGHRLIACGNAIANGEKAAYAAQRLMRVPPAKPDFTYIVPEFQWGGA